MTARIRGSDVYVVEDLERILSALAGAARRYAGEYGAGYQDALQDLAAGIGATTTQHERVHEVIEYRAERTIDRYTTHQAAPPAARPHQVTQDTRAPLARPAPADMTGDTVNVTLFNPACGRLATRQQGHVWAGNDGYTAFWDAADWQRVPIEEARGWGELVPDDYAVLVRHAYADRMRRQIAQRVHVVDNRRLLR